ncbi:hypothetical protein Zm00014a_001974 [Zea mays]|uniref:Uncharacterized protein n=1 Tax=Zea mays TaxID=4577 RepID=A0A317YB06_MAIZE|nr:hypothetical protein Zm00014a_001974 [Zea mays]
MLLVTSSVLFLFVTF